MGPRTVRFETIATSREIGNGVIRTRRRALELCLGRKPCRFPVDSSFVFTLDTIFYAYSAGNTRMSHGRPAAGIEISLLDSVLRRAAVTLICTNQLQRGTDQDEILETSETCTKALEQ